MDPYPEGWPRLAAEQNSYHNRPYYRGFGVFLARCMQYHQAQLHQYFERLQTADHRNKEGDNHVLKSLPGIRSEGRGDLEMQDPDEQSTFWSKVTPLMQTYCMVLLARAASVEQLTS